MVFRILSRPHGKEICKKICMARNKLDECTRWRIDSGERINFWIDS